MSNKEMLHRKQYRIAAVVAGLALAVSMTACGHRKGLRGRKAWKLWKTWILWFPRA